MASAAVEKLVETRAAAGASASSVRGSVKAYGWVFASSSAFKGDSIESMLMSLVRGGVGGGRGALGRLLGRRS